jgi:hypothetical protein
MLAAVGTLYISFLLSWILPKIILDEKVAGAGAWNVESGYQLGG